MHIIEEINLSAWRSVGGLLIIPMLLSSCIARKPEDLTVVHVETATEAKAGISLSNPSQGGSFDLVKIDVETRTDLNQMADSYGNAMRFEVRFCTSWPLAVPRSGIRYPDLLTGEGGNIGGSKDLSGLFHYSISVYIADNPADGRHLAYNLLDYPRDICISTRGGNETGFGYLSNDAVASVAQIRAAVSRRKPPTLSRKWPSL